MATDPRSAYPDLKGAIDAGYQKGRFVGIVDGRIVAEAATFLKLIAQLDRIESRPERRLVVQAGVDYPTSAVIRSPRLG